MEAGQSATGFGGGSGSSDERLISEKKASELATEQIKLAREGNELVAAQTAVLKEMNAKPRRAKVVTADE